jgi:hypothetical protein
MKRTLFVSRHRMTECPACHAHVRVEGDVRLSSCSFCGARLAAPPRDVFSRLLDLGGTTGGVVAASLLGLGLVRCTDAPTTELRTDSGDHMAVPLYGIPPVDSGLADATITDAREPIPAPEYGGPGVPDGSVFDAGVVADAAEPPPEPLYGIPPPARDAGVVVVDAAEPPPEPDYGLPPLDRDATVNDASDAPPVALYGIAPVEDAGATRVQDAGDDVPTPLYGGAAVLTPSDEILS